MTLLPVLVTFLLRIQTTYGAPHQTINAIKEQLKGLGYSISSPDNFENSLRCDTCQVTLKFQKSFQAVWLLRRHTREKAHQVKAGWILDDENNVQRSKPKGKFKSSRIKCCVVLQEDWIWWGFPAGSGRNCGHTFPAS